MTPTNRRRCDREGTTARVTIACIGACPPRLTLPLVPSNQIYVCLSVCSPLTLTLTLFLTRTLIRCLPGPPDEWTRLLLLLWLYGVGGTSTLRDGGNTHGGTPYALGVHDRRERL